MYSYVVYLQKVHVCIYGGRRDEISDYLLFFVHILFLPKRESERRGLSAENNLKLQASCESLPPCTENSNPA